MPPPAEPPLAPDTGERGACVACAPLYGSPVQVKRGVAMTSNVKGG
jgi:hypothetical protein